MTKLRDKFEGVDESEGVWHDCPDCSRRVPGPVCGCKSKTMKISKELMLNNVPYDFMFTPTDEMYEDLDLKRHIVLNHLKEVIEKMYSLKVTLELNTKTLTLEVKTEDKTTEMSVLQYQIVAKAVSLNELEALGFDNDVNNLRAIGHPLMIKDSNLIKEETMSLVIAKRHIMYFHCRNEDFVSFVVNRLESLEFDEAI